MSGTEARDDALDPSGLEALVLSLGEASPPPERVRSRLLSRLRGVDRFLPFLDRVAALFDLSEDAARAELDSIDQPDAWDELLPGIRFRDFAGGPALGDAHGGLVRMAPGTVFPTHVHMGDETVLVLQGQLGSDDGRVLRAGDVLVSTDRSSHVLEAVGAQELIYAVVVIALQFPYNADDDD